jgi:hypothetical protein
MVTELLKDTAVHLKLKIPIAVVEGFSMDQDHLSRLDGSTWNGSDQWNGLEI